VTLPDPAAAAVEPLAVPLLLAVVDGEVQAASPAKSATAEAIK
jgi:hypothetical protein